MPPFTPNRNPLIEDQKQSTYLYSRHVGEVALGSFADDSHARFRP